MKTNTALIIVIAILLVGGIVLFSSGGDSKTNQVEKVESASALTADRDMHDFGEIDIFSGKVTTNFTLTNSGPDEITIVAGTTSCACTDASIGGISFGMHEVMKDDLTILAGGTEDLTVIYDPLAHGPSGTGLVQRSVYLKTNSTVTPELEVRIKAMVTKDE